MGGGGLDGCFGEQGLPAGIQECLERFHRRCVDYLSRQFVPKWDSPNGEDELAKKITENQLFQIKFDANDTAFLDGKGSAGPNTACFIKLVKIRY